MAISNTKNNYLAKLFGRSNDKSRYAKYEEEELSPKTQAQAPGGNAPSGFIPENLPNYTGAKTIPQRGNPTTPSVGSVPASTIQQPQAGAGMPGAEGAEAKASRYNLLQMMQPEPLAVPR